MASVAKKASNIVVWILLGLLFVALAGFGVTSFSGGSSQVAEVGRANVTASAYFRLIQQTINQQIAATGQPVRLADLQADRVDEAIRSQLIAQAALDNEALEMGLSVSDETVFSELSAIPAFQGQTGFNADIYEATLRQQGFTPEEFEEQIRSETARALLQIGVFGGIAPPDALTEALVAREVETRDFTVARLSEGALPEPIAEPDAETLAAFHEENAARFETPETRSISYAWVSPDMLLDEVLVDEDRLRELYDARLDEFVRPERRLLERLVFPSQEDAQDAADALAAGETDFDTLVEGRGLTLDDVNLDDVARGDLSAAAAEAVFADDAGEIIGPVDSTFGPALFRVNAVLNATEVTFEEAREELNAELAQDGARRLIFEAREEIDDLLASGATLEETAEATIMRFASLDYGAEDASDVITGYDAFREAAETVAATDFPGLIELSDGGLVALRLDSVNPPELPPLAEIEDVVAEAWRAQALSEALQEEASALLTAIVTEGRALDAAGEAEGITLETFTDQGRRAFIPGLPPTILPELFDLATPGDLAVLPAGDEALVLRLDGINPGNVNSAEVAALLALIESQTGQSIA
ncbi:MAG: peptidyl-prolyl cis-trans isomerase, partial [Pseudomonadota bacterium]